ncbi:MAG: hypothetical protein JRH11_04350 [Deltaproteobacteria bacterium]|nr:hypothetical protein [Deltaproteobacteria bacterium]
MKRILLILTLSAACGGGSSTVDSDADRSDTEAEGPDESGGTAGAEAPGLATTRATGRNFSIPVPSGYRHVVSGAVADMMRDDVLTPGGVILMAQASDVAGAGASSIVVSPTAADVSADAVDAGLCGQLAVIVAGQHLASVQQSGMVELPWGATCQWVLRLDGEETRRRLGTVFAAHAEDWIVTCNYDERDQSASAACNEVLSGWSFAN